MKPKLNKVQDVALADLICNDVQPPWRAEGGKALEDLAASLDEHGCINPPVVAYLDGEHIVIDGHRRIAAARQLGWAFIKCRLFLVKTREQAEQLFAAINRPVKPMRGKDTFFGWKAGGENYLKEAPRGHAGRIHQFIKVFGEEEAKQYAEVGTDPYIVPTIHLTHKFLGEKKLKTPPLVAIGRWLIKHRGGHYARAVAKFGTKRDAQKLLTCIRKDKSYLQ